MKIKKNLTLISLMLGVMMLVGVMGMVSAEVVPVVPDTTAPLISNINGAPQYPTCTQDVTVCADITDNVGISQAILSCTTTALTGPVTTTKTFTMIQQDSNTYCKTFSSGTMEAADAVSMSCTVSAKDISQNSGSQTVDPLLIYDCKDPVAKTTGPYTCNEGTTINLDGSSSSDTVDTSLDYSWTGVYSDANTATPTFKCVDDGVNTVTLTVKDNVGRTNTVSTTVTVLNVDPVAKISGPTTGDEGSNVELTGSATDAGVLDTQTFAWTVDGNEAGTGTSISVHCVDEELISVALQVTDKDGGVGITTHTVQCQNVAPVVNAGEDQTVNQGSLVTIDPKYSDAGVKDVLSVLVDWGSDYESSLTHTYCAVGNHVVTVKVSDEDRGVTTDTLNVNVLNVNPTITSTGEPYNGVVNQVLTFNAVGADICLDTLTVKWDFGAGYTTTNTHKWNAPFSGTVGLKITDQYGGFVEKQVKVDIYDYSIHLNKGWNLISIPLVPENTAINFAFSTILNKVAYEGDNVATVLQYDAVNDKWFKARPNGEEPTGFEWASNSTKLENIVPGYGYYIKMADDATLYLNGKRSYPVNGSDTAPIFGVPPSVTLAMDSWNLIGVYGTKNPLISKALVSLTDEEGNPYYDVIYNKYGAHPNFQLNSKEGYWISVKKIFGEDQTIEYKQNDASCID